MMRKRLRKDAAMSQLIMPVLRAIGGAVPVERPAHEGTRLTRPMSQAWAYKSLRCPLGEMLGTCPTTVPVKAGEGPARKRVQPPTRSVPTDVRASGRGG